MTPPPELATIRAKLAKFDQYAETWPSVAEGLLLLFPDYTRKLLERVEALETALRDLSAAVSIYESEGHGCPFCVTSPRGHDPACPVSKARALLGDGKERTP